MKPEIDRRTFLKRMGQAGGLIAAGGTLESLLAACGGNVSTGSTITPTPGVTPIGTAGLKTPDLLQWGADYVSGAPYVFQDPANPKNLVGFEVEIAQAMANMMGIRQTQVEVCYSTLAGYTVGTGSGYLAETIMDKYNSSNPAQKINVKAYTGNIAFIDLVQHKLDAFFLDYPIATYYILGSGPGATPLPQLKLLGGTLYKDNYYVGFNKGNPNAQLLLPEINQAFARLKKDGTLYKIYKKWQLWNGDQAAIGVTTGS